jgi:tryptophanyl-tRNA synthetase
MDFRGITMERILSGIKPTGELTLGNYIGALRHFKDFQDRGDVFIFIADLHALTMPIDPEVLRDNSRDIAAFYLASGLDPKKCTIFLQSTVPAHAELNAIIQNYLYMGQLKRMTQFKDKCSKMNDAQIGLGIFAYPVLMAADILLYDANIVPVGEDQVQHVELCRDLVDRFNGKYGNILVMPKAEVTKVGARIMSLSDPSKKMSKSDPKGDIFLKEPMASIRKKVMSAVTDSGSEVKFDPEEKPGISNLLTIYAALKDITPQEAEKRFVAFRYGDFKKAVADAVEEELTPFKARYERILADKSYVQVLKDGAAKASLVADKTLHRVQRAVGLLQLDE